MSRTGAAENQMNGENSHLGFDTYIVHFGEEGGGFRVPVPDWVYRGRNCFVCPPLIFACISVSYETETDGIIWPLGTGIVLMGIVLRVWAQQHLHYHLKEHKKLMTTGPYGFVRNPLYIGNTIMCVGATIASELLWLIPTIIL